MSDRSQTIVGIAMATFTSGWLLGLWFGSRVSRFRDPGWRRSFARENIGRPSGPPPLKLRRSGDLGPPPTIMTPKPKIEPKGQSLR